MTSEVGRELKVSELKPKAVVCVWKATRPNVMATMWVVAVEDVYVEFYAGDVQSHDAGNLKMTFVAMRTGPDLDSITDNSHATMKMFEYLGEI